MPHSNQLLDTPLPDHRPSIKKKIRKFYFWFLEGGIVLFFASATLFIAVSTYKEFIAPMRLPKALEDYFVLFFLVPFLLLMGVFMFVAFYAATVFIVYKWFKASRAHDETFQATALQEFIQ